jgi:hypothetical protein
MPPLHSDRSRPYTPQGGILFNPHALRGTKQSPGRPVRPAVQLPLESLLHGNMSENRVGASRGHSSSSPANKGPNPEQEKARLARPLR